MSLRRVIDSPRMPEFVLRLGIRQIVAMRLRDESRGGRSEQTRRMMELIDAMRDSPIAVRPEAANDQHYELSPRFFERVLGPHLKYSGCYWPPGIDRLEDAEAASLAQVCERAQLRDGQDVLELGCGWGALSLWVAAHHPRSRVVAVTNSRAQAGSIARRASERGIGNLEVVTADMNDLEAPGSFDRVLSVEMFEHMRNYQRLLSRIASWMRRDARLFVHIFAHARFAYVYEDRGIGDWMAREFFTGGMMPSSSLLLHFQDDVRVVDRWEIDGVHYQKTAEAWLANLLTSRDQVMAILAERHGGGAARAQFARWRLFFLACAEMFGYRRGVEWIVAHYLFEKAAT